MKKDILIENGEIRIMVTLEPRKYAIDQRIIVQYEKDILPMIPEEYIGKVSIKESPSVPISNMTRKINHSANGLWVFEIKKPEPAPKKATSRRKPSTKAQKPATIKKVDNKPAN
ncbi:hypothetical protein OAA64_01120 [bacterium]|nr:hypothetical protein [bacterium]